MKKTNYTIPKLRSRNSNCLTDCVDGSGASSDALCSTGGTNNATSECNTGNVATNMTGGGNGCSTGNIAISNTTACNVTGQNAHSTVAPVFSCNVTGTSPTTNPPNPCNTGGGA